MLAAKLATEDCGRLLLAGERTVEVAHEALITQWPWLENALNEAAADMRVMDKAHRWNTAGSRGAEHLATGAERTEFAALAEHRPDWLSRAEPPCARGNRWRLSHRPHGSGRRSLPGARDMLASAARGVAI